MASISTVLFLNWLPTLSLGLTLGSEVELVVKSAVDLSGLTILPQKSPENSLPADPKDLGGHPALAGTLSLTETGMATTSLGFSVASGASS